MAVETKLIPTIAKSAIALAQQDFQRVVNALGAQTLEAMGLDGSWVVNFSEGVAVREVPDIQPDSSEDVAA